MDAQTPLESTILHHWPLDPAGRLVRLHLGEKAIAFETKISAPWSSNPAIRELSPGAVAPALLLPEMHAIGTRAICEFLEDRGDSPALLPADPKLRAEARRIWAWVEAGFEEVTDNLLTERVMQWVRRDRDPDSARLRRGAHALRGRVTFLNALLESNTNLAGREMTLADLAAAAHLSAYDYFGDVEWAASPDLRDWYARIKSRPSFRPLLADRLDEVRPVAHYADLDF